MVELSQSRSLFTKLSVVSDNFSKQEMHLAMAGRKKKAALLERPDFTIYYALKVILFLRSVRGL